MATKELKARLSVYTGTAENWEKLNPVLLKGEPAYETDTGKLKFGDGTTEWKNLPYFLGDVNETIENYLTAYMKIEDYIGSADGVVKSADKLETAVKINGVEFDGTADITVEDDTKIPTTEKGVAGGVATLDEAGQVPSSQLPSYVDDVVEGYYSDGAFYEDEAHSTGIEAETGKIYVDLDTEVCYRWSGSLYIEISNPLDIATEEEALAGTDDTKAMTPLKVNLAIEAKNYVTNDDERLSDSRTPTGDAGGDLTGEYPNPTIAEKAVTTDKIADEAVTNDKLADGIDATKLTVFDGDVLVINGGEA